MSPLPEPPNDRSDPINQYDGGSGVNFLLSSDEEDATNIDVGEYQLLPQEPQTHQDNEDQIDYNSLSGLMSALDTHGPNEFTLPLDIEEEYLPIGSSGPTLVTQEGVSDYQVASTSQTEPLKFKDLAERQNHEIQCHERAELWNTATDSSKILIDSEKEEEIKSLMARIKLPPSAIPPWANQMSDEELQRHLSDKIPSFKDRHSK